MSVNRRHTNKLSSRGGTMPEQAQRQRRALVGSHIGDQPDRIRWVRSRPELKPGWRRIKQRHKQE